MIRKIRYLSFYVVVLFAIYACNIQEDFEENNMEKPTLSIYLPENKFNNCKFIFLSLYSDSNNYHKHTPFYQVSYSANSIQINLADLLIHEFYYEIVAYDTITKYFIGNSLQKISLPSLFFSYTIRLDNYNENFKKIDVIPYLISFKCTNRLLTDSYDDEVYVNEPDIYICIDNEFMSDLYYGINIKNNMEISLEHLFYNFDQKAILFYDFDYNYSPDDLLVSLKLNVEQHFSDLNYPYYINVKDDYNQLIGKLKLQWIKVEE